MILYLKSVFATTLVTQAVIDTALSVIWVQRFQEPGEFEIYMAFDAGIFNVLSRQIGQLIVTRDDSDAVMYVEHVKVTESATEGDFLTISGRTIDCVLGNRVIIPARKFTATTYGAAIRGLINDNAIDPGTQPAGCSLASARVFPLFAIGSAPSSPESIAREYFGENLLEAVHALLVEANLGLRVFWNGSNFYISTFKGYDRPNVIFSENNENLLSCEYNLDLREAVTSVYISATGPDTDNTVDGNAYTTIQEARPTTTNGYVRREAFTTGSAATEETITTDVSSSALWGQGYYSWDTGAPITDEYHIRCTQFIPCGKSVKIDVIASYADVLIDIRAYDADQNFIQGKWLYSSGKTYTPPANAAYIRIGLEYRNGGVIDPTVLSSAVVTALCNRSTSDYKDDIKNQGYAYITPNKMEIIGETITGGLYEIGADYGLGDTVHIQTRHGITGTARVCGITEVDNAEGYRIYPTFDSWTAT
jgi:hypothetical protein